MPDTDCATSWSGVGIGGEKKRSLACAKKGLPAFPAALIWGALYRFSVSRLPGCGKNCFGGFFATTHQRFSPFYSLRKTPRDGVIRNAAIGCYLRERAPFARQFKDGFFVNHFAGATHDQKLARHAGEGKLHRDSLR